MCPEIIHPLAMGPFHVFLNHKSNAELRPTKNSPGAQGFLCTVTLSTNFLVEHETSAPSIRPGGCENHRYPHSDSRNIFYELKGFYWPVDVGWSVGWSVSRLGRLAWGLVFEAKMLDPYRRRRRSVDP